MSASTSSEAPTQTRPSASTAAFNGMNGTAVTACHATQEAKPNSSTHPNGLAKLFQQHVGTLLHELQQIDDQNIITAPAIHNLPPSISRDKLRDNLHLNRSAQTTPSQPQAVRFPVRLRANQIPGSKPGAVRAQRQPLRPGPEA